MLTGKALTMGDSDDITIGDEKNVTRPTQADAPESSGASRRKGKAKPTQKKVPAKRQSSKANTSAQDAATPIIQTTSEPDPTTPAAPANVTPITATQVQPTAQADISGVSSSSPSLQNTTYKLPRSIASINELPSSIKALEDVLPIYCAPLSVDTVEEDAENELATLALAEVPDFPLYLEKMAAMLKTQRAAITTDDNPDTLSQLEKREQAVLWFLTQYRNHSVAPATIRNEVPKSTDDTSGPCFDMEMDTEPQYTCELLSVSICFM